MKRCAATLLWCPLQQSQNKGLHFEVELWWHGALKVLCCCVSYCFLSSLLACCLLCLRDKPLLCVAGCSTATSALFECQSRQSVGGIVSVIDHQETDVQSCPEADSNANPKNLNVCKPDCFLVGLKLILIRLYRGNLALFPGITLWSFVIYETREVEVYCATGW